MSKKNTKMTTCENFFLLMPCPHICGYGRINRKCKTKQNIRRIELKRNISVAECEIFFYYVCVQIWLDSVALCMNREYSQKKMWVKSNFFSLLFLLTRVSCFSVAYFLLSSPMQQKQIQIFLHIQHTRHKIRQH